MQQIKIGKAPTNDIVINDKTVSREHLVVFIDDDKNVFITDLGSTNGTYVNGVRIEESVKLETLDVLRVGNSLVEWPQFLISNNNLDKVYETLKDPDPIFKEKPVLKSEATNLKPIYKYSLIFVIIIVVVIIIMSLADRKTT